MGNGAFQLCSASGVFGLDHQMYDYDRQMTADPLALRSSKQTDGLITISECVYRTECEQSRCNLIAIAK